MKYLLPVCVLLISFKAAIACSYVAYPDPPVEYIAANTGKIFLGRVIAKFSAVQIEDDYKYRVYRVKLRVEKAIKGVAQNEIYWVRVTESINQLTSCSTKAPKFKKGALWIIHEDFDETSEIVSYTGSPSSFDPFSEFVGNSSSSYIERLEKAVQNPVTAIYGQIQGFRGFVSLVDADVFLEGSGLNLKTKTNNIGEYSFKNLPAGNYKIRVPVYRQTKDYFSSIRTVFDAQTQKHNLEYEVSIKPGGSHYQYMVLDDAFFSK